VEWQKNKEKKRAGYKPNSVPCKGPWSFHWDVDCSTPLATYPEISSGPPSNISLFGLAPDGVYLAPHVTMRAVSSYLAVSPLPGQTRRFNFCGTFPRSPEVRVTNHPALRSSDFPLRSYDRSDHAPAPVANV